MRQRRNHPFVRWGRDLDGDFLRRDHRHIGNLEPQDGLQAKRRSGHHGWRQGIGGRQLHQLMVMMVARIRRHFVGVIIVIVLMIGIRFMVTMARRSLMGASFFAMVPVAMFFLSEEGRARAVAEIGDEPTRQRDCQHRQKNDEGDGAFAGERHGFDRVGRRADCARGNRGRK